VTTLYLVRHGEVAPRRTFYGHLDVELSAAGLASLRVVAQVLAAIPVHAVYSSDLQRAAVGAALIAAAHGLSPRLDPAFREMSLGVLEGVSWDEGRARLPELATKRYRDMWDYRFPEGETLQDVAARVWPALEAALAAHDGGTVVLVSHNSVNRLVLGRYLGLAEGKIFDFDQDFGCINRVALDREPRVELLNWTPDALLPRDGVR
jgi:broad specificity phosphatase PhoE